jgi:hypothetical protein
MKKKIFIISAIMVVLLGACGPAPAPTMSPADVQGTAVAGAWTMVAMTQAAIPTATPLPPTETPSPTPLPTFTPLPPPTLAPQTFNQPTVPAANATVDLCNLPVQAGAPGHHIKVHFLNKSGGTANLAFGLVHATEFGECGTYQFPSIDAGGATVEVLEGCYWAYAWITGKVTSTAVSTYNICLTDPSHKWTVTIKKDVIGFYD